jgi:hypothetical protein
LGGGSGEEEEGRMKWEGGSWEEEVESRKWGGGSFEEEEEECGRRKWREEV